MMAEPTKLHFKRGDGPQAEAPVSRETPARQIKPQRPHSVSRELGSVLLLLIGIAIGVVTTLAVTTSLIPIASEIIARGVAIGAASK
jgi:hypothetical protein